VVFYVNVPIGVAALTFGVIFLQGSRRNSLAGST